MGKNKRRLSSMNLSDEANLDSFIRGLGFELIHENRGVLKINLNPNSEFERRVAYIGYAWEDKLSVECPIVVYNHFKSEGFDVKF